MIVSRGEILRALKYLADPAEIRKLEEQKAHKLTDTRSDSVQLSPLAEDIKALKKLISQVPDVREDKVGEIKRAIESGTYQVDPILVAEKILGRSLVDAIGR